jgi:glycosyltransferase involved in cell wall biosynthesis
MTAANPLVSVVTLTYNHEPYIAQAIESVLAQKTDFPFEYIIGEDCSTDRTRAIVDDYARRHPDVIRVVSGPVNIGAMANIIRVNGVMRGKYIATLEGDDFWNDASKLQRQVDFLERNPEYGVVHTDVHHLYAASGRLQERYNHAQGKIIPEGDIFEDLLDPEQYIVKTPTALFRKELQDRHVDYGLVPEKGWVLADLFNWLSMARFAKFKYFPEATATYRVLPDSCSNTKDFHKRYRLHRSLYEIRIYFAEQFSCEETTKKKINACHMATMLFDAFRMGDRALAEEMHDFAKKNAIGMSFKNSMLSFGTSNRLVNRILNLLW